MKFTKMHGLGNDFILIDCISSRLKVQSSKLEDLSGKLCNRRFGIGADQLLLLSPSKIADFKMSIFNADGSEVEMCGNGIRCLAKYIWEKRLSDKKVLNIETLAGIIKPEKAGEMIKVDMGEPVFEPEKIPVRIVESSKLKVQSSKWKKIIDYPLRIKDKLFYITCLSMGNPHAVIFVKDLSEFPVSFYGPLIEKDPIFPKRTNVEFIEVINPNEVMMRVWERGAGETMACGTGASAVAVATNIKGITNRTLTVHLTGGDLFIEWSKDNHVYMTGPAVKVFEGVIEID
ncbi:MAG: diaminopimelate epimerase [Thermodesulfovibrionales bacterium]